MATTLPGMPLAAGDVFVCGPEDIAPWEQPRRHLAAVPPAPVRRPQPVWLVLATCPHCNPRTGHYCREHDATNWWLETMASAKRKNARPRELTSGAERLT